MSKPGPKGNKYGMTMPEISRVTGLSVDACHNYLRRGIRKLAKRPDASLIFSALMSSSHEAMSLPGCGSVECRSDYIAMNGEEA